MRDYRKEHYPPDTMDECEKNIKMFFMWMHKRHNIWHRRFVKKLPREKWTKDKILKTTKYTNVYRQLDRGTLWYLQNIMEPLLEELKGASKKKQFRIKRNLIWKTIIYRLCNRIETFEEVGVPDYKAFEPDDFFKKLDKIRSSGRPVMTSAHLTCPSPKGMTKVEGYLLAVYNLYNKLSDLTEKVVEASDARFVFNYLTQLHAVGGFIAYEVYCDLCYGGIIPFTTNDFVNIGPGAKEGIRLLFPSSKGTEVKKKIYHLWEDQNQYFKKFGIKFKYYNKYEPVKNQLSLRSIEHSLCEFSKYWLQNKGLGKQRMIFAPDTHASTVQGGDILEFDKDYVPPKKTSRSKFTKEERTVINLLKKEGLTKEEIKELITELR